MKKICVTGANGFIGKSLCKRLIHSNKSIRGLVRNLNKSSNNIKVQYLGNGPFTACYSLIYPYLRFLPIFSHLVLLICFMLDNILQIFIKTDLKKIFPIGIFFNAQKK